jgi:hypothetical protein
MLTICFLFCAVSAGATGPESAASIGIEIGHASQQEMWGSYKNSRVRLGILHVQVLTRFDAPRADNPETFQLVNEITLAQSTRPGSRFVMGISELLRYTVGHDHGLRAFGDVGAGISSFGLRVPEVTGWMQYQIQFGAGLKYRPPHERITWLIEYRLTHFSCNYTSAPNYGLNFHVILVGVNF